MPYPLFIVLLFLAFNSSSAFALEQQAGVTNLKIVPIQKSGAHLYSITGIVRFKYSIDELAKAGDSTEKVYRILIHFKEGDSSVPANTGYKSLSDSAMNIAISTEIEFSMRAVHDYSFSVIVPAAAFNLVPGPHSLKPVVTIVNKATKHTCLNNSPAAPVTIQSLALEHIVLWVKRIEVDSVDEKGQLWDFFLFNPEDANPDLVWSFSYGEHFYFSSRLRKNVFVYADELKKETFETTICTGDNFYIQVKDVDELTPDDIIGTISVNPTVADYQNNALVNKKAGQIKELIHSVQLLSR